MASERRVCSIAGCSRKQRCRGWCKAHYARWQRHGDPTAGGTMHGEPLEWLQTVAFSHDGDDCLIWPFGRTDYGYGIIKIDGKSRVVSNLLCEMVYGARPSAMHECAHSCGKGHLGCVNKGHLRWATRSENHQDKIRHGTHQCGEKVGNSKLTRDKVLKIRSLHKIGFTQKYISDRFGISQTHVSVIVNRHQWAWLND